MNKKSLTDSMVWPFWRSREVCPRYNVVFR